MHYEIIVFSDHMYSKSRETKFKDKKSIFSYACITNMQNYTQSKCHNKEKDKIKDQETVLVLWISYYSLVTNFCGFCTGKPQNEVFNKMKCLMNYKFVSGYLQTLAKP